MGPILSMGGSRRGVLSLELGLRSLLTFCLEDKQEEEVKEAEGEQCGPRREVWGGGGLLPVAVGETALREVGRRGSQGEDSPGARFSPEKLPWGCPMGEGPTSGTPLETGLPEAMSTPEVLGAQVERPQGMGSVGLKPRARPVLAVGHGCGHRHSSGVWGAASWAWAPVPRELLREDVWALPPLGRSWNQGL